MYFDTCGSRIRIKLSSTSTTIDSQRKKLFQGDNRGPLLLTRRWKTDTAKKSYYFVGEGASDRGGLCCPLSQPLLRLDQSVREHDIVGS